MRNFMIGLLLGLSLAFGISATALTKPTITGGSGRLESVEVLGTDQKRICEEPYWHEAQKIISCE